MEHAEVYRFFLYCIGFGLFSGLVWAFFFDFPKW